MEKHQLHAIADMLNLDEVNYLSNLLYERKKDFARLNMKPLNTEEIALVKDGQPITAIKVYRERIGCSLLEAKVAIDSVRS